MSTEQKNNHSNNGTRNAGAVLGAVSVLVALFYVSADSFGYKSPDWSTFKILLVVAFVSVDSFVYKLPDWLTLKILLVLAIVLVDSFVHKLPDFNILLESTCVLALIIILIFFSSKNIANFLGEEKFHSEIKLFICPLILIVIISMLAFPFVNSNYENIDNVIVTTCKSNAPEKKKKSEKTEKNSSNKKMTTAVKSVTSNCKTNKNASSESNASNDTKDSEDEAKIDNEKRICINRFITFVTIATIFYIAQLRKTAMKNEYDEIKTDLDYMHERNRYVNYDSNNPNSVVEERKEFTEKKETLKYYSSMKNNYEAITILFVFISLIMGFSKLG
ncbi:hypothetical protein [Gardnerella sp. KA00747]|uniref:hypothetical protein n=1 Tax=Gardnerella sp. KA00747 TaxID=2749078 RepID=UPI003BAB3C6E